MTNSAKGRESFDITVGDTLVNFFNRNASEYPTEVGSVKFDAVTVTQERDQHLNQAYQHANEELDRLREHAEVLQRQYQALQRRVMLTELVHKAHYMFVPIAGRIYHLYHEKTRFNDRMVLMVTAPDQWSSGIPKSHTYQGSLRKLGDNTWESIDEKPTE